MNTINLSDLVKGLMVVIAIAMSMGKLPELKRWAIKEAFGPSRRTALIQKSYPKNLKTMPPNVSAPKTR